MQNFIYLVGDREKRECVIVDPAWDVESVLRAAAADEMKVTGALVTHSHFDHVNGLPDFAGKNGGKIYIHKKEAAELKNFKGDLVKVDSGDKLKIGGVELTFLHTPGHTPGSQCFLINCPSPQPSPLRGEGRVRGHLISGDTLFINACGRCDLPGGNAEEMYESLQRLSRLDEKTILFPGHNYENRPTSTIGDEKRTNPYLQSHSLQDFLHFRMGM